MWQDGYAAAFIAGRKVQEVVRVSVLHDMRDKFSAVECVVVPCSRNKLHAYIVYLHITINDREYAHLGSFCIYV